MSNTKSRRNFLKLSAAAGAALFVSDNSTASLLAANRSANERVRIACIGVGGKGESDTRQAGQFGDIVGLCDIDDRPLNKIAADFPKAKKYHDFRKMLEEIGKDVDGVTVSTPDHTHAVAAMMAIKLGKGVYCQKPLTRTVHEARALRDAARQHKVATQMGNQGSASDGMRRSIELIQGGLIGDVTEVHVWTNRPIWPQAPKVTARLPEAPVPETVHWDLFLGPAPLRPYNPGYHPFNWRGWWDFGTGAMGDMACHTANMAFRALKLEAPTSVAAMTGEINPETFPAWATITYNFPQRGTLPPTKLVWYEGKKDGVLNLPSLELMKGQKHSGSGSLFIGTKGTLYSPSDYGSSLMLLERSRFEDYVPPAPSIPRHGSGADTDLMMKKEWTEALKGGPVPFSNFEFAAQFTETMLLGNVAMRTGKPLEWDAANLKVTNVPEAAQYIRPEYRSGWSL